MTNANLHPLDDERSEWLRNIYYGHFAGMMKIARGIVHDHAVAQDVVGDSFARIAEKMGREPDRFKSEEDVVPYLLITVRNTAVDYAKGSTRLSCTDGLDAYIKDEGLSVVETIRRKELKKNLEIYISRLPEKQREAIRAVYSDDLDWEQAAARLQQSIDTVRKNVWYARNNLSAMLKKDKWTGGAFLVLIGTMAVV